MQERPSSERKHQKPEVLTSSKIGEFSNTPSERKDDFSNIVLSDKQQELLMEIYPKMRNEAGKLVEEDYIVMHLMLCIAKFVLNDLWIIGQGNSSRHMTML